MDSWRNESSEDSIFGVFLPDWLFFLNFQQYFSNHAATHQKDPDRRLVEQNKLASNVIIGLVNYELWDKAVCILTPYAQDLLATTKDSDLYESFARKRGEYVYKNNNTLLEVI